MSCIQARVGDLSAHAHKKAAPTDDAQTWVAIVTHACACGECGEVGDHNGSSGERGRKRWVTGRPALKFLKPLKLLPKKN